jgi:PleD family two-component response regulator
MSTRRPRPRLLVVGSETAAATSAIHALESEHAVIHVSEASDALFAARYQRPDAILIEGRATQLAVLELARSIHADPIVEDSPILLISPTRPRREDLIVALAYGIWHVFTEPLDLEELRRRLDLFTLSRRSASWVMSTGLVDPETGLYNAAGMARRGRELGSEAARQRTALAVIALAADLDSPGPPGIAARCAQSLRNVSRLSDVVGRLGPMEFLVLAPATTSNGASMLAHRFAAVFRTALLHALPPNAAAGVRAGYRAIPNLRYAPTDLVETMSRAAAALRGRAAVPDLEWIDTTDLDVSSRRASGPAAPVG